MLDFAGKVTMFLSRLYGGELVLCSGELVNAFLSRLYGGEQLSMFTTRRVSLFNRP